MKLITPARDVRAAIALAAVFALAACGSSSPTAPSSSSSTPPAASPTTFTLSGTVTSTTGIGGISGATLTIADSANVGRSTTTGSGGSYSLSGLSVSGFTLAVAKPGYRSTNQGVTVTTNTTANITLTPQPAFTASGVGANVVNVPDYVTQLAITGTLNSGSANFAMWFGPQGIGCGVVINGGCHLLVNELLGPLFGRTVYTGTVLTGAGGTAGTDTLSVVNSTGVAWTVTDTTPR